MLANIAGTTPFEYILGWPSVDDLRLFMDLHQLTLQHWKEVIETYLSMVFLNHFLLVLKTLFHIYKNRLLIFLFPCTDLATHILQKIYNLTFQTPLTRP